MWSTVRGLSSLTAAERSDFDALCHTLEFEEGAQGHYLLRNPELMDRIERWAGADPARREAKLQMLLAKRTGKDYDFAALRAASTNERREELAGHAALYAFAEDLLEGPEAGRRNVRALVELPPAPGIGEALRKVCYPAEASRGAVTRPTSLPAVLGITFVPPGHVRFISSTGLTRDVLVDPDTMSANEALNLCGEDFDFGPRRRSLIFERRALQSAAFVPLREAGVVPPCTIHVRMHLGGPPAFP